MVLALTSIHIFRLGEKFPPFIDAAILFTLLPYIPFIYMSQTRHKEFSVFWLMSIFIIILQAAADGRQDTKLSNIKFFSVCFIVLYSVLVSTMNSVFNNFFWVSYSMVQKACISTESSTTCSCQTNYIPNDDSTACRYAPTYSMEASFETIFAFGLLLLVGSLNLLQGHVRVCREKKNERQKLIDQINIKNNELKEELDKELSRTTSQNTQKEGAFISPISKVIKIIRNIQINSNLDDETIDDLDYVVHLLLSNHLFKPQLMNSNMEAEVNQWLKQITESDQKEDVAAITLSTKPTASRKATAAADSRGSGFHIEYNATFIHHIYYSIVGPRLKSRRFSKKSIFGTFPFLTLSRLQRVKSRCNHFLTIQIRSTIVLCWNGVVWNLQL